VLTVEGLNTFYGAVHALKDVSLEVRNGELVALIGANGAGKTTLLRTISGLVRPTSGRIVFDGRDITHAKPSKVVQLGIAHCPEGRRVWPRMTVQENLLVGAFTRRNAREVRADLERVYAEFPRLGERRRQLAGTLSGGEQQMLAIGRALMAAPKLVLFDEPSLGLAPIVVESMAEILARINKNGTAVFLVEQNASVALHMAQRAYVLETGKVMMEGRAECLRENEYVKAAYLGAAQDQ